MVVTGEGNGRSARENDGNIERVTRGERHARVSVIRRRLLDVNKRPPPFVGEKFVFTRAR